MKKIIISLLLLTIIKTSTAQLSNGIKGGLNYSNIYSTNLNTNFKQGYHLGIYTNINLVIIAIQPELLFSKRGYTETNGRDVSLNYIDLPILLKVKILPLLTIDAGPQFSFLVKDIVENNTTGINPNFNKSELSGAIGTSIKIWRLGASARYIVGLSELEKAITSKNQQFQLSLSLKL